MYELTIHIASADTPLSDGEKSFAGHMWYSIRNTDSGKVQSFGFGPPANAVGVAKIFGPGVVFDKDTDKYLDTDPKRPIFRRTTQITEAEFNTLESFGKNPEKYGFELFYNGLDNNCIDFTWRALYMVGFNRFRSDGSLFPKNNYSAIEKLWYEINSTTLPAWAPKLVFSAKGDPKFVPVSMPGRYRVSSLTTLKYLDATSRRPRDPLAIDLDGDGIETVGVTATPILFDHNGDGLRTGTGWVKGDDAWLVLDRNGNGLVDSGRELFGVDTVLSGTAGVDAVFARSGFEALLALDTGGGADGTGGGAGTGTGAGAGDGAAGAGGAAAGAGDLLFDARDAAFSLVRL